MTIQQIFLSLPTFLKDAFAKELTNLGIILSMNEMEYNHRLRSLINGVSTPLKLKRLYRFMLRLNNDERNTFFNNFSDVSHG